MQPDNELEVLFVNALRQLSDEFQARQNQITEQYTTCMKTFNAQSASLQEQYDQVLRQLDASAEQYEKVMALLTNLNAALART